MPFYIKMSQIILGVIAFFYVLYIGQDIIVPLVFSVILAILMNPMVNFLHRKKMNRTLAIFISILLMFFVFIGIFYFIGSQASMFSEALPQLKIKFTALLEDAINWVSQTFNVSTRQIDAWIAKQQKEGLSNSTVVIGQTLNTISGVLVILFLLPVYIFLFLFYKPLLLEFIARLFPQSRHKDVVDVLNQTKTLIQGYLVGLLAEAGIVAALNATGLFILGIDYALLIGVIGALLNMIPYIGGLIAIALPMLLALATKEPVYALYVMMSYLIVQFIDNNFIVPKIVASKVKINALVSIVVVLIGGALWGVSGMFLSLPLTAIVKVIFDRVESLAPFGFLLGDTMPQIGKNLLNFTKKKKQG